MSIVTPSYNQGPFLETTIRSVLLQAYPNLEYIVMDGGSTDGSVAIIEHYDEVITHWQSERDQGQADAISRGFARASGDILGWVNSDDYFLPGALSHVGRLFTVRPDVEFIVSGGIIVDAAGRMIRKCYAFPQGFASLLAGGQFFMQMSSFWRRDAYEQVGGLDASLRFCFDYDLFLRLARRRPPERLDVQTAAFRVHERSKTTTIWSSVAIPEIERVRERHGLRAWSDEQRERESARTVAEYYRVTRRGILRDAYRDPGYFMRCVMNKARRRPGSAPLGQLADR